MPFQNRGAHGGYELGFVALGTVCEEAGSDIKARLEKTGTNRRRALIPAQRLFTRISSRDFFDLTLWSSKVEQPKDLVF